MTETATLGGGCFWCLQPIFQDLKGVAKVEAGYAGGTVPNPTYGQVCTDRTGHAEVVQVTFDAGTISYEDVLRIFFTVHDPTSLNRQGHDVGTQYRSVIFAHSPAQEAAAKNVIAEVAKAGLWKHAIVTEVVRFQAFYRAEEYHQDYFRKNPFAGYCQAVVAPKVAKFRKQFAARLQR